MRRSAAEEMRQEKASSGARLVRASAARAAAGRGRHGTDAGGFAGPRGKCGCTVGDCARSAADEALDATVAGRAGVQLRFRHLLPPLEMAATFAALVLVRGHGSSPASHYTNAVSAGAQLYGRRRSKRHLALRHRCTDAAAVAVGHQGRTLSPVPAARELTAIRPVCMGGGDRLFMRENEGVIANWTARIRVSDAVAPGLVISTDFNVFYTCIHRLSGRIVPSVGSPVTNWK
jgi:hypothetical protein